MGEYPTQQLMEELLEFVDEVVDELGVREEVNYVREICANGTGADRQLRAQAEHGGDLNAVVDLIISETQQGLPCG